MFTHSIDPILFTLGPFTVRMYGVLMAAAFLLGYFILIKLAKEKGLNQDVIEEYFLYMLIGLIVGARLGHILFYNVQYYLANPIKILFVWEGGLASHGAMIAGILVTIWFAKKKNIQFYDLADITVIPIALGAMFVRLGNFTNAEIVGRVTNVSWATIFPNVDNQPRHPSQLYEALKNLIIFGILWRMRLLKNLPKGFMFWSFIWIYAVFRFTVEFFKEYQGGWFDTALGLTTGQWLSVVFFVISSSALFKLYSKPAKHLKKK